jgi:hypothetical protein
MFKDAEFWWRSGDWIQACSESRGAGWNFSRIPAAALHWQYFQSITLILTSLNIVQKLSSINDFRFVATAENMSLHLLKDGIFR